MNRAVFLDRDGILIRETGEYNYLDESIELVDGIEEALVELKKMGFIFIVITNQGGIGKGLYTHERVIEIHQRLSDHFSEKGIRIEEFFFCPHHPLTSECLCRKPDSLMLEKAMALYDLKAENCWFIGDNERDKEAGEKVKIPSLLVPSNADLREYLNYLT